jgi:hypothetical protein
MPSTSTLTNVKDRITFAKFSTSTPNSFPLFTNLSGSVDARAPSFLQTRSHARHLARRDLQRDVAHSMKAGAIHHNFTHHHRSNGYWIVGLMNPVANKSAGWSHDISIIFLPRSRKGSSSFSLPPTTLFMGIYGDLSCVRVLNLVVFGVGSICL